MLSPTGPSSGIRDTLLWWSIYGAPREFALFLGESSQNSVGEAELWAWIAHAGTQEGLLGIFVVY
jgi:hypothetical protein